MRRQLLVTVSIILLVFPCLSIAAGPGSGRMTKNNIRIGQCRADSMTVQWKLGSLMGEPTVAGSFKWRGQDCRLPSSTTIWLKVVDGHGGRGYVRISPATPKANSGYGYNTTGSPNWKKALCGYSGTSRTKCYGKKNAIAIWKNGYVDDFTVQW
ncbi:MAG: hypothetical protein GY702_14255 [Desulfobulbaceae bacterium]|nr:hypothetical protein [Desulfobulbaceae bacterium]